MTKNTSSFYQKRFSIPEPRSVYSQKKPNKEKTAQSFCKNFPSPTKRLSKRIFGFVCFKTVVL